MVVSKARVTIAQGWPHEAVFSLVGGKIGKKVTDVQSNPFTGRIVAIDLSR